MNEVQSVVSPYEGDPGSTGSAETVPEPFLPLAEAARALRISPTTLRRYIQDYSAHIDAVREGRKLMVAVSSIPALAQVRDLRARKIQKSEIDNILSALPGEIALSGLAVLPEKSAAPAGNGASSVPLERALRELRTDLNNLKRESRDSEVVVRQSLANILFLIEKCSREVQYHVSEDRLASNERDLKIAHYEQEIQRLSHDRTQNAGWLASLRGLYRRMLGAAFSR
jgi:hypothetical protein